MLIITRMYAVCLLCAILCTHELLGEAHAHKSLSSGVTSIMWRYKIIPGHKAGTFRIAQIDRDGKRFYTMVQAIHNNRSVHHGMISRHRRSSSRRPKSIFSDHNSQPTVPYMPCLLPNTLSTGRLRIRASCKDGSVAVQLICAVKGFGEQVILDDRTLTQNDELANECENAREKTKSVPKNDDKSRVEVIADRFDIEQIDDRGTFHVRPRKVLMEDSAKFQNDGNTDVPFSGRLHHPDHNKEKESLAEHRYATQSDFEKETEAENFAGRNDEWSTWSAWSNCSASCGESGSRTRIRACEGVTCPGQGHEHAPCSGISQCKRLSSLWNSWLSWDICSVSCGPGTRVRSRVCSVPKTCKGSWYEIAPCILVDCPESVNIREETAQQQQSLSPQQPLSRPQYVKVPLPEEVGQPDKQQNSQSISGQISNVPQTGQDDLEIPPHQQLVTCVDGRTCLNGGTCRRDQTDITISCLCADGYSGKFCEQGSAGTYRLTIVAVALVLAILVLLLFGWMNRQEPLAQKQRKMHEGNSRDNKPSRGDVLTGLTTYNHAAQYNLANPIGMKYGQDPHAWLAERPLIHLAQTQISPTTLLHGTSQNEHRFPRHGENITGTDRYAASITPQTLSNMSPASSFVSFTSRTPSFANNATYTSAQGLDSSRIPRGATPIVEHASARYNEGSHGTVRHNYSFHNKCVSSHSDDVAKDEGGEISSRASRSSSCVKSDGKKRQSHHRHHHDRHHRRQKIRQECRGKQRQLNEKQPQQSHHEQEKIMEPLPNTDHDIIELYKQLQQEWDELHRQQQQHQLQQLADEHRKKSEQCGHTNYCDQNSEQRPMERHHNIQYQSPHLEQRRTVQHQGPITREHTPVTSESSSLIGVTSRDTSDTILQQHADFTRCSSATNINNNTAAAAAQRMNSVQEIRVSIARPASAHSTPVETDGHMHDDDLYHKYMHPPMRSDGSRSELESFCRVASTMASGDSVLTNTNTGGWKFNYNQRTGVRSRVSKVNPASPQCPLPSDKDAATADGVLPPEAYTLWEDTLNDQQQSFDNSLSTSPSYHIQSSEEGAWSSWHEHDQPAICCNDLVVSDDRNNATSCGTTGCRAEKQADANISQLLGMSVDTIHQGDHDENSNRPHTCTRLERQDTASAKSMCYDD